LYKADWSQIDGTTAPLTLTPRGRLVDALDVAYAPDEARCAYETYQRIPVAHWESPIVTDKLGGRELTEAGRVIIGTESFTVSVTPARPLRIVMRGALKGRVALTDLAAQLKGQEIQFVSPLKLNVLANEQSVGSWAISIKDSENLFEAEYEIPASFVTQNHLPLTIGGDHISLGYWFYQD
jgi:hypothetical protein